jgi:UDP-N-acetylmuramyl tripeptide synthase
VRLFLAKNPAGWDDALATMGSAQERAAVVSINSGIPDGLDPSWIWDAEMGRLGGRRVVASGRRAEDLAVRLVVAGLEPLVEPALEEALLLATGQGGAVDLLADYTSFQAARRLISDR